MLYTMNDHDPELQRGIGRFSVPQAARRLGISERAVRKRIQNGTLAARRDGSRWIVFLPTESRVVPGPEHSGTGGGTQAEPVEARFRVTPAEIEQAIERTGDKYVTDLRAMFDEIGRLYQAQLDAKDQTISVQQVTIDELRRHAEQAEQQRNTLRERLEALDRSQTNEEPRRAWWRFWRR